MCRVLVEQDTNTDAPPLFAPPFLSWRGVHSMRVSSLVFTQMPKCCEEALCTFYWGVYGGEFKFQRVAEWVFVIITTLLTLGPL